MNAAVKKILEYLRARTVFTLLLLGGLVLLLGFLSWRVDPFWIFAGLGTVALAMVILENPWHGLYLFVFFIPFERLGSYDIAGVTVRPSQVTALLVIISVVLYNLGRKKFPLPRIPIALPLALFVIIQLFGLLNAPNLERSVMVTGFTIFTFFIGIMIPFVVKKKEVVERMLQFFFFSMLLVTLFGLYQFVGDIIGLPPEITGLRELYTKEILGFPRVQSTALEPLYFANYLLVPLSVLLSLFLARDRSMKSWMVIGLFGLGLVNLVLTVARGGYIGFAASALVLLAYYFFQLKLFTWRNLFYAAAAGIAGIVLVTQVIGFDVISTQFLGHVSGVFEGASFSERVDMFSVAEEAWRQHPVVGIGSGSFGPFESWHPLVVPEQGWRIVNNEYLELLAENGTLGFAAMVAVFLVVIIRSVKALTVKADPYIKTVLVAFFAAFVGILVQYNTFSILYIVHIWFVIGMLIALQNMVLHKKRA
ncbi:MAG: O-antigen ligase family protein [Candidatus Kerfeldbacteria bacterium]